MKKSLVFSVSKEEKQKERLKNSIEKKTKILEELMAEAEMLKIELDLISHEYNVRIGSLLLKDNQLDVEILQLKNLQELMKGGMTYEKALKHDEDTFYAELFRMQKEQEKLDEEKKILEDIVDVSDEVLQDIKTIWKKLIRKFHPDLVINPTDKTHREEMMKKINKAYAEHNLEMLLQIESIEDTRLIPEFSVEQLEESLVKIENAIEDAKGNVLVLQKSPWYEWKKKRDKQAGTKVDVFTELEKKFLDDIVKKIEIVQKLREDVHPK